MATTYKPLYPTLQPNYQPNMGPWNNNNNYPQSSYDNDGQRSGIVFVFRYILSILYSYEIMQRSCTQLMLFIDYYL